MHQVSAPIIRSRLFTNSLIHQLFSLEEITWSEYRGTMKFSYILMLLGALVVVLFLSTLMKRSSIETFDGALPVDDFMAMNKNVTNINARRYNSVSDTMNKFLPGYLNSRQDNEDQASDQIKGTMNSSILVNSTKTPSGSLVVGVKSDSTHSPPSSVLAKIKFCEALKGSGEDVCTALDNPAYAECGVCLKAGTDSSDKPTVGGLYFAQYDRQSQALLQANVDPMFQNLKPTIGKCANIHNFVTTGDRCRKRRQQMLCEATNGLPAMSPDTNNNCSQCVEQGLTFLYRGAKSNQFNVNLYVIADGNVFVQYKKDGSYVPCLYNAGIGSPAFDNTDLALSGDRNHIGDPKYGGAPKNLLPVGPRLIVFGLVGVKENDGIALRNDRNYSQVLAAQWNDKTKRTVPFYESIVNKDKVQLSGTINSTKVTNTVSATDLANFKVGTPTVRSVDYNASSFDLNLVIPGFLGEPDYDEDAALCPSSALLGTPTSMTMMKSNPCFTENPNAPLTQKCVSNLFLAVGGTVFGTGYPVNQAKTDDLLSKLSAQNSLDAVLNYLNGQFNIANTGQDANGRDLDIDSVNAASKFMLGIEIRSPCDINSETGPLTNACLQFLYDNKGVGKNEGQTYESNFGQFSSYCTIKGTISPTKPDGSANTQAIQQAKAQGGVRAVQKFYSKIYTMANTAANAANAGQVMDALGACYGIVVPQQVAGKTACDLKVIAEYDIMKKPVNNTQMTRMTIENNSEFGPMADVDMILQRNGGTFKLNKNTVNIGQVADTNCATVTITCRKAWGINFWIRCDTSQPGGNVYLMDLRADPNSPESYLWKPNDGSFWAKQKMYLDGQKVQSLPWPQLLNNKWHMVSFILQGEFNGDMSIFSRYSAEQGLSAEFGPVTIYGQIPDPKDPKTILTFNETDITSLYNSRPDWANIPNVMGYEYQGCWGDDGSRTLPNYLGQVSTKEQCAQKAKDNTFNAFGLQYYGECWAGNYPDNNYKRNGERGQCSPLGDGWTNQVYFNPDMKPTLNNSMAQARHSGKCFDIYGFLKDNGTRMIQYSCHGGDNQRFDYNAQNKTISVKHSGKCLTVKTADPYQQVVQQPCVGTWNQQWDMNDDGTITLSGTKMTMDVKYASTGDIVDVIIWPKNGGDNEKFNKIR